MKNAALGEFIKFRAGGMRPRTMIRWFWLALFLAAPLWVTAAEEKPLIFYVQLIRGGNEEKPPEAKAKPVGPKLSQLLTPVFRWKHYWEVSEHEVKVSPGKVTKLPLKVRDLEIQLLPEDQLELRLYQKGKLVRTSRQKLKSASIEVMGGSPNDDNAWFVVVRKDKPQ